MTATLSARDHVAGKAAEIGSVPHLGLAYVCPCCFGPVVGYPLCYGCGRLFAAAPSELRGRVVPMSIVINPSLWYGRLVNYKNGSAQDHTLLAALIAAYLAAHEKQVAKLLGGALSHIVVVPSTRGRRFEVHPLANAVKRSRLFGDHLANALTAVPGATISRQEYKPSIFTVEPSLLKHARVVVIEDLWVSGAHAVSAAGAVMEAGAESVVILPIAREIRPSTPFCPDEYVEKARVPYDIDAWPR